MVDSPRQGIAGYGMGRVGSRESLRSTGKGENPRNDSASTDARGGAGTGGTAVTGGTTGAGDASGRAPAMRRSSSWGTSGSGGGASPIS